MQQRLIVFCSDVDLELERVRRVVGALREQHPELGALELEELDPPAALATSGWTLLAIRPLRGRGEKSSSLEPHLDALVQAFAGSLEEQVVAVYHDVANGFARASLQKGKGPLKRIQGDAGRVVRQAATWLACDAAELAVWFRDSLAPIPPEPANPLAGAIDAPADEPADPDEDDRFVEDKLRQARELMEKYRAGQK